MLSARYVGQKRHMGHDQLGSAEPGACRTWPWADLSGTVIEANAVSFDGEGMFIRTKARGTRTD